MKVPGMLLLLLGVVAVASAERCNNLQRIKTKMQWAKAYGTGARRAEFGDKLWQNVFNYAPGARGLFSGVNSQDLASPEFKAHIARVLGGLDRVISMLDNQATLDADLLHLKSQHDTRNIDAGSFAVFRDALIGTVAGYYGSCVDVPAWFGCYNVIAQGITGDAMFA